MLRFEVASRAVCASEVADLSEVKRRIYSEANWQNRLLVVQEGYITFMQRQGAMKDDLGTN